MYPFCMHSKIHRYSAKHVQNRPHTSKKQIVSKDANNQTKQFRKQKSKKLKSVSVLHALKLHTKFAIHMQNSPRTSIKNQIIQLYPKIQEVRKHKARKYTACIENIRLQNMCRTDHAQAKIKNIQTSNMTIKVRNELARKQQR